MTVTAKTLIESMYAPNSITKEYQAPSVTTTIIDKFTATNTSGSAATISIYLVPSGGSAGGSNLVISAFSIAAGVTQDFTQLQNHILSTADFIAVVASVASAIVIRASGREIA